MTAFWRSLAAALVPLCLAGCAALAGKGSEQSPEAKVSDEPVIIGRVALTLDGRPVNCTYTSGNPACGLVVQHQKARTFLIPYDSHPSLVDSSKRNPFFVIRVAPGEYTITQFETSLAEIPPAYNKNAGNSIAVRRKFVVNPKESVYIGSLNIDIPSQKGRAPRVVVVDESDSIRSASEDQGLDYDLPRRDVTVRLLSGQ